MPIYEYLCKKCGHKFEKIQKFSDRLIKKCPECGGPVEQTITAPAVQFKGTGWYVTDYANKGKSSSPRDSSSSSEKDDSSGPAKEKGDTKDSKETREAKESSKESKDSKDSSESKLAKEHAKETKESKTTRPGSKKR